MNSLQARALGALACVAAFGAGRALAAEFGMPGGPEPTNIADVMGRLRQDPYDLELLISFGTSKGGSAGHLALALREPGEPDDWVYSANFYADRAEQHAQGRYTAELVTRVPKSEYLYGTRSSLGPTAEFGLDFGEAELGGAAGDLAGAVLGAGEGAGMRGGGAGGFRVGGGDGEEFDALGGFAVFEDAQI